MRYVAIDIETTGKRPDFNSLKKAPKGYKPPRLCIEIGAIEVFENDGVWTLGNTYEVRLQPGGPIEPGAVKVHGIHPSTLKNCKVFSDIFEDLKAFLGNDTLIAHAWKNECDYLNYDALVSKLCTEETLPFEDERFVCTQEMGQDFFPGSPKNLDSLLDRLAVDRSDRFKYHGSLLDATLTAEAFIKMNVMALSWKTP